MRGPGLCINPARLFPRARLCSKVASDELELGFGYREGAGEGLAYVLVGTAVFSATSDQNRNSSGQSQRPLLAVVCES